MKYKLRSYLPLPEVPGEEGGGDLSGLRSALDKERKAREAAERKLREREDADSLANKSLADQVAQLQAEKAQLQSQIETERSQFATQLSAKDVSRQFTDQLAAAKVLPEYRDRFGDIESSLTVENGKLMRDGQPFDVAGLRQKYPGMFAPAVDAAGSGSAPSNGTASAGGVRIVSGSDIEATRSVDPADLASGKVVIE